MWFRNAFRASLRKQPRRKLHPYTNSLNGPECLEGRICPGWLSRKSILRFIRHEVVPFVEKAAVAILAPQLGPLGVVAASVASDVARGETGLGAILRDAGTAVIGGQIGPIIGGAVESAAAPVQSILSSEIGGTVGQAIGAVPVGSIVQSTVTNSIATGQLNPAEIGRDIVAGVGLGVAGAALGTSVTQIQSQIADALPQAEGQLISAIPARQLIQQTVLSSVEQGRTDLSEIGHDLLQTGAAILGGGVVAVAEQTLAPTIEAVASGVASLLPDINISIPTAQPSASDGKNDVQVTDLPSLPPGNEISVDNEAGDVPPVAPPSGPPATFSPSTATNLGSAVDWSPASPAFGNATAFLPEGDVLTLGGVDVGVAVGPPNTTPSEAQTALLVNLRGGRDALVENVESRLESITTQVRAGAQALASGAATIQNWYSDPVTLGDSLLRTKERVGNAVTALSSTASWAFQNPAETTLATVNTVDSGIHALADPIGAKVASGNIAGGIVDAFFLDMGFRFAPTSFFNTSAIARIDSGLSESVRARTFFHYTDEAGLTGILDSGVMRPSLRANNPMDVRYGEGQYFSHIVPGSKTPAQLSTTFLGHPFQGQRFSHYLELDLSDLDVIKGREGVYVVLGAEPLAITGRVVNSGAVSSQK